MKGKHFVTIEKIKEKSKRELLGISKSAFQKCFEDWKKRCVNFIRDWLDLQFNVDSERNIFLRNFFMAILFSYFRLDV